MNQNTLTRAELANMKFDNDESASNSTDDEEEELHSSRVENLHWCTCQECYTVLCLRK